MAAQLPWDLEEEILSRLPPQPLVRFRIVCKRWNRVCKDKTFQHNHLSRSRPQFILLSRSKSYSIDIINPNSIAPEIALREIRFSPIPHRYLLLSRRTFITSCDELLFCNERDRSGSVLWNPWLKQAKRSKNNAELFNVFGVGYDNTRPEKVYKILCFSSLIAYESVGIYEFASQALKFIDIPDKDSWLISEIDERTKVSLNGNLYWLTRNPETHLGSFDFSAEIFKPFCLLPCQKNNPYDEFLLAVLKRDRFSLLKECYETWKVEIWVTNKIHKEEEVVWIKLMTLPETNLPPLCDRYVRISYFIYDKTLFMCYGDNNACIFIVRGDMCKEVPIDSGIIECFHFVSTPNLITVP